MDLLVLGVGGLTGVARTLSNLWAGPPQPLAVQTRWDRAGSLTGSLGLLAPDRGASAVNCQRKESFRVGHYELARRLAAMFLAGLPADGDPRAARLDRLTTDLMNLDPGWRWVTDRAGARREYVPMLRSPWPDWGDLREHKLREKLCAIYSRAEYRTSGPPDTGGPGTPPCSPSSPDTPPPPSSSPAASSPAERWQARRRRPASGPPDSAAGGDSR